MKAAFINIYPGFNPPRYSSMLMTPLSQCKGGYINLRVFVILSEKKNRFQVFMAHQLPNTSHTDEIFKA